MKEKIKEILRTHVHKHEYPVDPADIWAGMQKEINLGKKKDKRRLFFIFFSFAFLALVGTFSIYGLKGDTQQFSDFSDNENVEELSSKGNNSLVDKSITEFEIDESNDKIQKQQIEENRTSLAKEAIRNDSESMTESTTEVIEAKPITTQKTVAQSRPNNQSKNSIAVENKTPLPFANYTSVGKTEIERESEKQSNLEADYNSKLLASKIDLIKARLSLESINNLSVVRNTLVSILAKENFIIDDDQFSVVNTDAQNFKRKSISLIAGAGVFTKKVIAFDESQKEYALAREKYEIPLELVSIQALVNVPLISKLSFSTGIQYLQFNEEFDWKGTYYLDAKGDVIESPSEYLVGGSYYQEINHALTTYNKAQLITVPVLLGVSDRKKRLSYGLKAGLNIQLKTQSQGTILAENLTPINILNPKFGLGLQSRFELGYFITPSLEILGDFSVLQVTATEEHVKQQLRSYLLGLGLRQTL